MESVKDLGLTKLKIEQMELNKMNRYWDENDKVHGECGKKIHELENAVKLAQEETEQHRRGIVEATREMRFNKDEIKRLQRLIFDWAVRSKDGIITSILLEIQQESRKIK